MAQSQIRSWPPSRGSGMQSATWGHSRLPVTGKRTLPDQRSPLLLFQSQMKLSHPVHLTSSTDHLKRHQVRPAIPTPITGHDCQDPGVRRPIGLGCAKLLSSDLMTWIFKISQISGQKDTATAKCTRDPIPQILMSQNQVGQLCGRKLGTSAQQARRKENSFLSLQRPCPGSYICPCKVVVGPYSESGGYAVSSRRTLIRQSRAVWERQPV